MVFVSGHRLESGFRFGSLTQGPDNCQFPGICRYDIRGNSYNECSLQTSNWFIQPGNRPVAKLFVKRMRGVSMPWVSCSIEAARPGDIKGVAMATELELQPQNTSARTRPLLKNGDRLTQAEFLCRCHAMPNLSAVELIEGRVYTQSPVSAERHGEPNFSFITWLGLYRAMTSGVVSGDNSTLQLDVDNAPQRDGYLRLTEQAGGQSRLVDGYVVGGSGTDCGSRDRHGQL